MSASTNVRTAGHHAAPSGSSTSASPFPSTSTSSKTHGLLHQGVLVLAQDILPRLARDHLLGYLQKCGHRERRHTIQLFDHDSPLDGLEHVGEAADIQEAGCRILIGCAQQDVI